MHQPNPDEPCQWCGATEHREPIRYFQGKDCAHCGGTHHGSFYCPYSVTQIEKEQRMPDQVHHVKVALPKYKCHKEVWALKIDRIEHDRDMRIPTEETDGSATLFDDKLLAMHRVTNDFVRKHNPQVGGYLVIYEDGYKSFSPAKAFEEGYSRI
jgi:hypothetical protein